MLFFLSPVTHMRESSMLLSLFSLLQSVASVPVSNIAFWHHLPLRWLNWAFFLFQSPPLLFVNELQNNTNGPGLYSLIKWVGFLSYSPAHFMLKFGDLWLCIEAASWGSPFLQFTSPRSTLVCPFPLFIYFFKKKFLLSLHFSVLWFGIIIIVYFVIVFD